MFLVDHTPSVSSIIYWVKLASPSTEPSADALCSSSPVLSWLPCQLLSLFLFIFAVGEVDILGRCHAPAPHWAQHSEPMYLSFCPS